MRLHILGDLHLEFGTAKVPVTDADVVVLAGDIHLGREGRKWARGHFQDKPVVYVLGNHEFYRHSLPDLYVIGSTRVLTNQRGYPDQLCKNFDPSLVVEV